MTNANKTMFHRIVQFCATAIISQTVTAFAQDAHYWTNQYGTRAQLLGGVVVGSIEDLSSTFYNPGAIALTPNPTLVLSTNTFELIEITHEDGAGLGDDLRNSRFVKAPSIFAFGLGFKGLRGHRFAFSILTRHDVDVTLDARHIDPRELLDGNAGELVIASELIFRQKIGEVWVGVPSWARKLSDRVGVGVTQYGVYRNQKRRFQAIVQALNAGGETGSANYIVDFSYKTIRLLWKAGLSFDFRPLTFGFTVTTPSLHLLGDGSELLNVFVNNIDVNGNGSPDNELASNYQDKLKARFKSPLSIAAGASYKFRSTAVHVSAEWFDKIGTFEVMSPQPFRAQSSNEIIAPKIVHAAKSVTNFGIGLQHTVHAKLGFYGGFTTDFSTVDRTTGSTVALGTWNIKHVTIGSEFTVATVDLTLGLGYGFGEDSAERLLDFGDTGVAGGEPQLNQYTFRRLRFIFGLTVPL